MIAHTITNSSKYFRSLQLKKTTMRLVRGFCPDFMRNKDGIMYTLLGSEDNNVHDYESKFIVQLERERQPSRRGLYVMTALFVLLHFQTATIDTLNRTSSYLGPTTLDHDVIGFIVTSSRFLGGLLGVVLSLVLGCRLAWPLLLYMVAVFSTTMAMPGSKGDVMAACVCHVFQAFGTGLIETQTFFLVHKMYDVLKHKAIALQLMATSGALAGFLAQLLMGLEPTEKQILPSLSWAKNETNVFSGIDGQLPSLAIVLAVSAILISAAILCMHQLFPIDCIMLSSHQKPREANAIKYKTCLAFVFPAVAVTLSTLNHTLVAQFSTDYIAILSGHRAYSNLAFILFTIFAGTSSVIVLNVIGNLTNRQILLTASFCQIAASISFLVGNNVTVVIATSINAMAFGTASIIIVALLWAMAFHNHTHILIATLVVAKSGVAENMYYLCRFLLTSMDFGGDGGWIYVSSVVSVLFFATVYLGHWILVKITKKDVSLDSLT